MVANVTIQTTMESLIYGDLDSLTQLQNGNFLLSQPYFKELNDNGFQINEFRFFCHKPSHGRTLHIASTSSSDGKEWVQYLVGIKNLVGLRCEPNCVDVFRRLEGDNSLLAQYGNKQEFRYARTFKSIERVYEHNVYVPYKYHIIVLEFVGGKRLECDDTDTSAGVWKIYIR